MLNFLIFFIILFMILVAIDYTVKNNFIDVSIKKLITTESILEIYEVYNGTYVIKCGDFYLNYNKHICPWFTKQYSVITEKDHETIINVLTIILGFKPKYKLLKLPVI